MPTAITTAERAADAGAPVFDRIVLVDVVGRDDGRARRLAAATTDDAPAAASLRDPVENAPRFGVSSSSCLPAMCKSSTAGGEPLAFAATITGRYGMHAVHMARGPVSSRADCAKILDPVRSDSEGRIRCLPQRSPDVPLLRSRLPALLVLALVLPLLSACGFNTIPTAEEKAKAAWSEVLNQYQRRADLIPNLVETVKGYAAHEREMLEAVVEARAKATQVTVPPETLTDPEAFKAFQDSQSGLTGALSRLLAVVENYPDLKANQNFLALQAQLEGTENRIAVARRDYIEAVRDLQHDAEDLPVDALGDALVHRQRAVPEFHRRARTRWRCRRSISADQAGRLSASVRACAPCLPVREWQAARVAPSRACRERCASRFAVASARSCFSSARRPRRRTCRR